MVVCMRFGLWRRRAVTGEPGPQHSNQLLAHVASRAGAVAVEPVRGLSAWIGCSQAAGV